MNKVAGKIILKETGVGIPDLLVAVFDVDPNTSAEETFDPALIDPGAAFWKKFQGDRLGSVLTDENGRFALEYEDTAFKIRNAEKRPDLMLVVTAPEEPALKPFPPILHVSCGIRQNAGQLETYLIRLTSEQMKKAGLEPPAARTLDREKPERIVKQIADAISRREEINKGIAAIMGRNLEKERSLVEEFEKKLKAPLLANLSKVPERIRKPSHPKKPSTYVLPGASVENVTKDVIAFGIENVINASKKRAPVKGHVLLTEKERQDLKEDSEGYVSAEKMERFLAKREKTGASLVRQDPLTFLCREKSHQQKCGEDALGIKDTGDSHHGNNTSTTTSPAMSTGTSTENDVVAASEDDVPRYIGRLMTNATSPEEPIAFGNQRADQVIVKEKVKGFELPPGPADSPSFHDFHSLQIAFEHVWQEAIDDGILSLAESAYHDIVELGGDPDKDQLKKGISALLAEGHRVLTTYASARGGAKSLGAATRRRYAEPRPQKNGEGEPPPTPPPSPPPSTPPPEPERVEHLPTILAELEERLREPYVFTIYAANAKERSVNFGIIVTYRQKWEPQNYQAGRLIKTIPLAPKETRKFVKKTVVKKSRAEKEVENSLHVRKTEAAETSRAESEIVAKAQAKTNFNLTASASYNGLAWSGSGSTAFSKEAATESQEVKKAFHEAVFKAAEEYKSGRTVEINTSVAEEVEAEESGEISNPNDELAVTFLFYELQRRYLVSENIHQLTPVVLVAQEVPAPHEIDEDWLVAHDWILRRVILDDSFLPALSYLSTKVVGDEYALEEMRKNVEKQRDIVDKITAEVKLHGAQAGRRYEALQQAFEERAVEAGREASGGLLGGAADYLLGGGGGDADERARLREEAAKDAYERAAKAEKEMRDRLEREVTALNSATEAYTKILSEHLNRKTQIARLRVHVKQNILYYMQAIWSHEPPDQRFFRLHQVQVPVLSDKTATARKYKVGPKPDRGATFALPRVSMKDAAFEPVIAYPYPFEVVTELDSKPTFTTLADVADLDSPLGYKGNYMIFPLKESNALTDFMMAPYVNQAFELHDPDDLGNCTLDEFLRYVCCLEEILQPADFKAILPDLREQYKQLLTNPRRNGEYLVVPTNSLFIEALPSAHPILEDFKLMHRAIDVKKVQSEVRKAEMENIRAAARLLAGEREDPDIERKIVIEGDGQSVIVPPVDS